MIVISKFKKINTKGIVPIVDAKKRFLNLIILFKTIPVDMITIKFINKSSITTRSIYTIASPFLIYIKHDN